MLGIKSHYLIILLIILIVSPLLSVGQDKKNDSLPLLSKAEQKAERKKLNSEALKGNHFQLITFVTWADMSSGISISGPNGVLGASLSLENFLGFDKYFAVPSFMFKYSFTRRSSVYAEYYNIHRKVKYDLQKEFEFGEISVPIDAGSIKLFFNTDIWSVGYRYSFINAKKANLSFFFNIYILRIATGIDIDKENIIKNYAFTAPLPSLGYHFSYEMSDKFTFVASASYFFLELDGFGGFINNSRLSVDYKALKWLKAGLGFNYFNLRVNTKESNFSTDIEYSYFGPVVYAGFEF